MGNPRLTVVAVGVTVCLWASAFVGIRAALVTYSPVHLAVLRFVVASIVLGGFALSIGIARPTVKELAGMVGLGAAGIAAYNLALNFGERSITAGSASFLVNTVPIITALLAWVAGQERLGRAGWIGSAVSFAGVSMVAVSESGGLSLSVGTMLVLAAAVCQSVYFVFQKPLLTKYGSWVVTTWAIWGATLLMLPLSGGLADAVRSAPFGATCGVIYLGIFPGAVAYLTWAYALRRLPVAKVSTCLFAVPPVTIVIGWFWLREVPGLLAVIGGLVAIAGVAIVNASGRAKSGTSSTPASERS